jgi:tetratricopeptide (TPR) repeat protein
LKEEWGVTSFLDLLLRIFTALNEEYHDGALARQVESLYELSPNDAKRKAATLLEEYVGGRTLLLLMENLDELFNEIGEDGQRHLRAYLQEHPFCMIVATAQSLFNSASRRTSPFYGFFRIRHLEALTLDDAVRLLTRIALHENDYELVAFLRKPEGRARVRAVEHLSGGNHHVYVILAQFLTHEPLDELVDPFLRMLDDLTPYYQARMAWLSPQQRKIVNFLCDYSSAVTVKEIAQRCFVTPQTASSQLKKLQDMGYVHSTVVGRESFYELREPLMRLGTEVKKQRGEPIRLFVEFLRHWYSHEELTERLKRLQTDAALDREYLRAALRAAQLESTRKQSGAFDTIPLQARESEKAGTQEKVSDASDRETEQYPDSATAWFDRAQALCEEGRYEDAIAVYDEVVVRFGAASEPALQRQVVRALVNKGETLGTLGRYDEAINAYDRALTLAPTDATAWHNRAVALFAVNRWDDALAALDDALSRFPEGHEQLDVTPADESLRLLLTQTDAEMWQGRIEALIALYDKHHVLAALG